MIGKIYIKGPIGSSGETQGVELSDIIAQVQALALQNPESYLVDIDSPGGSCNAGNAIADYLQSLPVPVDTITTNQCCSMGTRLFVIGRNRTIVSPCQFRVHNPFLTNVDGDADELIRASEYIREEETKMINIYSKATGVSKEGIAALMREDKDISEERAKELGFATEVRQRLAAVAWVSVEKKEEVKTEEPLIKMDKEAKSKFEKMIDFLYTGFGLDKPAKVAKGLVVSDDKGTEIEIMKPDGTPSDSIAPGDTAMSAGAPVLDGPYILPEQGVSIVVSGGMGMIEAVNPIVDTTQELASLQAKVTELEKENAELKASKEEGDKATEEIKGQIEGLTKALATIQPDFKPPVGGQSFGRTTGQTLSMKEKIEARKKEVADKKTKK